MDSLTRAINTTPIIDHHGHNLLLSSERSQRSLLSITTEAEDGALTYTESSLAHIRAVKQLASILGCEPSWPAVQAAISEKQEEPKDAWAKRCFEGIETVLIDDGLDADTVHSWEWHDRLTRSPCKRIVRIERVAEELLDDMIQTVRKNSPNGKFEVDRNEMFKEWTQAFEAVISKAMTDPDVVAFKSVIGYRTGLDIPGIDDICADTASVDASMRRVTRDGKETHFRRLDDEDLSPFFVHITASMLMASKKHRKPFQFHTGLGDRDITLSKASPSHMQPFIESYPDLPIVLLHASYPFTREAGYLASVYENVYMDIGEVFPMVSQDGQETVIRESLELCPSEKLIWSTDGHWFPETYLLAVQQIREGLTEVLTTNVRRGSLTVSQAVKIVEDILFNTSNELYNLGLTLKPTTLPLLIKPASLDKIPNINLLKSFLIDNPSTQYLRLQWMDYTGTLRLRILPVQQALTLFNSQKAPGVTKAVWDLLQNDWSVPGLSAVGEYDLIPCFDSIRLGQRIGYATVQCEFREKDGRPDLKCTRTALRNVVDRAASHGIEFLIGFEIEVVFVAFRIENGRYVYDNPPLSRGHAWAAAHAMRDPIKLDLLEEILAALETSKLDLLMLHPESAPGQYEFVMNYSTPLAAVDALIATREIICAVAESRGFRATLVPKPVPMACGTGAHVHISMTPESKYSSFYAGVLKHFRAISAFTLSGSQSYERMQPGTWAGGRWVAWGTQNRETPLRKIEQSHWEFKAMDGLAQPYLAIAAILGAGLKGVMDEEKLVMGDCFGDAEQIGREGRAEFGITEEIPKSINEALESLVKDEVLSEALGPEVVKKYLAVKKAEQEMLGKMEAEPRRIFMIEHY